MSRFCFIVFLQSVLISTILATCGNLPSTCRCESQLVECRNLNSLPPAADFPADTQEYIFYNSSFTLLPKIEYTNAVKLLFINGMVKEIEWAAFSNLKQLRHLDLSNNKLDKIQLGWFYDMKNLTNLHLAGNKIENVTDDLTVGLPALEELNLDNNKGIKFEQAAFRHGVLRHLSIDGCDLVEAPVMTRSNLDTIRRLDMNYNKISLLGDGSFWQYGGLQELHLEDNQIAQIHSGALEGLQGLSALYLGANRIQALPEAMFKDTTGVRKLDLRKNNLTSLTYDVIGDLKDLEWVDISENPLTCDCSLIWLNEEQMLEDTRDATVCARPEKFVGYTVLNATQSLDCLCGYTGCSESSGTNLALAVGIPIIIVCCALIAFFVYKIVSGRKGRHDEKGVRYSAVYKDTTEHRQQAGKPTSEL